MSISQLLAQYGEEYVLSLLTTWKLTAICFFAAFVLGILITVLRVSPIRPLRIFADLYVQIFRNIPGACLLILILHNGGHHLIKHVANLLATLIVLRKYVEHLCHSHSKPSKCA